MMKNWPLTVLTAWISVRLSFVSRIHLKTNPNAPSPNFTPIRKCFLCIFFLGIVGGISISLDAEVGVWEDGLDSGRDINSVLCWILFLIREENVWSYGQSSKARKLSFKQEKLVTFTIFITWSSPDSEVWRREDASDSGRGITSILCCIVSFLIKEDDVWSYAWKNSKTGKLI